MKNTVFRIILTALTASLSLASCTKEITGGDGGPVIVDGMREFTVSFTVPTKSAPGSGDDGWQHPVFSTGDVIKVSNATESEDCTVTGSGSTAKIRTSLSGTLKAVYPSTAAILSSGTTGYITGFKVPAAQDGTFAAANICMAENIAENATSITFVNETALFKVTPPSGVTQFTVTSLKAVVDGVARTGAAVPINSSEVVLENKVITVSNPDLATFYVSLLPGAKLSDLSFEYTVTGETYDGAMKGIPEKDIQNQATAQDKTKDDFNTLAAGNAYTIGDQYWHPYVTIGGLKWATMNVGATTVAGDYKTCRGDYYQWGSVNTLYTAINWTSASAATFTWADGKSSGYVTSNIEYTPTGDETLPLVNDVAYVKWGGPWRMPTGMSGDFDILRQRVGIDYAEVVENGIVVHKFTQSGKTLIIPAAGRIDGASIEYPSYAYCWSSTYNNNPWGLELSGATPRQTNTFGRGLGFSIRPVADLGGFGFESYTDNGPF